MEQSEQKPSQQLIAEVQRRRTFAIISHPDAGKTTLTEKLLLYGGAIHLAGAVKAKKNQKHTTSDWMDIEKERGISISASVLQFDYGPHRINLLDTPGHKDFSEDTYRTLTAADAAVMLIDAAKGVEPQTRKLFEVCAMRGIPIFTFVNKMDRPCREPLDLLDELEKVLGIRSCPITWPIGTGDLFRGVYMPSKRRILLYDSDRANVSEALKPLDVTGPEDAQFQELLAEEGLLEQFKSELELLEMAGDPYDAEKVLQGKLSPVFFGSALNNFGVESFLQEFIQMAPQPSPRSTTKENQSVDPLKHSAFSGFFFKIQANMDPRHRDRVAFMRLVSGKFSRNMEVRHARLDKTIKLARPLNFFAQERVLVEEAWPGDIVGLVDTSGDLRIGDTVYQDKAVAFTGVPSFSPEYFSRVSIGDPMKRKQMQKGLEQLAEEGVVQIYLLEKHGFKDPILAAVGALQFEVLKSRLESEYGVEVRMESLPYSFARWVVPGDKDNKDNKVLDQSALSDFDKREDSRCVWDKDGFPVVLFKSQWAMNWAIENYPQFRFLATAPYTAGQTGQK